MRVLTILIILTIGVTAFSGETIKNPIEVGGVRWGRDLNAALENSAKTGKPVLVPKKLILTITRALVNRMGIVCIKWSFNRIGCSRD
jgi:hypothetical protein